MLKEKQLKPCAQVNVIMAPEVGEFKGFLRLENKFADAVISNEEMRGGVSVGGSATYNSCQLKSGFFRSLIRKFSQKFFKSRT